MLTKKESNETSTKTASDEATEANNKIPETNNTSY